MPDQPEGARHAAGCVVYRRNAAGEPLLLLIHDQYGYWTIPKGHLDAGENAAQAAVREVREETGVEGELGRHLDTIRYTVHINGAPHEKRVDFFLMETRHEAITPQAAEGIRDAGWYAPEDALATIGYDQVRAVVAQAITLLG
jgi:8-oxo-dGTP pyrophosphatase MutT (NUDIX family)